MSKKFKEAEAERALMQWAYNNTRGYVKLGTRTVDCSDVSGGINNVLDDYSSQEERCLKVMAKLKDKEPTLYKVALLEYVWEEAWFADCRKNGGWREDITHIFHKVTEPRRRDYMQHIRANHCISRTQYFNRRTKLIHTIAEEVV